MKHLLKIVENKKNHEPNKKYSSHKARGGCKNSKLITFTIDDEELTMTRMEWSKHPKVKLNYATIAGRHNAGKPIAQVLGFEKLSKERKNGKHKNSE